MKQLSFVTKESTVEREKERTFIFKNTKKITSPSLQTIRKKFEGDTKRQQHGNKNMMIIMIS